MRSSLFMRRLASFSLLTNAPLAPTSASSSSRKMVDGELWRAISKRTRTSFSDSPLHLLTSVDAVMLKKVVLHSVATALASIVFPVPSWDK
uniref:Putative secreted protein n=1 Tax=Ixodes ricinus TaxID=34613 RepID=A0A6B0UBC0_IXORI